MKIVVGSGLYINIKRGLITVSVFSSENKKVCVCVCVWGGGGGGGKERGGGGHGWRMAAGQRLYFCISTDQ